MRALYTLTLFLSSFLLFLVQPLVAKMILPTFGGAPQVWNTSMVFFQLVLLLGYGYAHLSSKWLGPRQPYVHLGVMAVAALVLPFSTHTGFFAWVQDRLATSPGAQNSPGLFVLIGLLGLVGLPFFALSAGAPLVQRWFAQTKDPAAKDPYFLYSASNLGSLLALFAYPFLLEPRFQLGEQSQGWRWAYFGLVGAMGLCAFMIRGTTGVAEVDAEPAPAPDAATKRLWIALSAVPSSLLLGVTTYLTGNIAPVPLLWVVPLALYLVTFILAFSRLGGKPVKFLGRLLPLVATPLAVALILESSTPIVPLGVLHLSVFFVAAWMCHARLSASRPATSHLTEFYFYLSLGGVIGGAFTALLAPVLFNGLYEYPLALVLACLLRPPFRDRPRTRTDYVYPLAVGVVAVVCILAFGAGWFDRIGSMAGLPSSTLRILTTIGIPLVLAFIAVDSPLRYAGSLGAVFLATFALHASAGSRVVADVRSFFGVSRVLTLDNRFFRLVHGNTLHGMQDRKNPKTPLTYYHPTGPLGQVFKAYRGRFNRVALVGLGVGSIAAYGEPGQSMTFFEIDPEVVKMAQDPKLFTFLRDTKANLNIVVGDARLTLARSPEKYDLIVLDAFSSDAIPVHLLTREAIQMYLSKLNPGGILLFHISNRYLELSDMLTNSASALGLVSYEQQEGPTQEEMEQGKTASQYMAFARRKEDLKLVDKRGSSWTEYSADRTVRPWTDDFSNVLSVFNPDK